MKCRSVLSATAAIAALLMLSAPPASAGEPCEVCVKVLDDVRDSMDKPDRKKKEKIEEALGSYCAEENGVKLGQREKKICYYIDPIKRDVAQPFSLGLPSLKVCHRIEKLNPEVCHVSFPVKTEKLTTQDLSKMRVKQLKGILADRGVECKGCVEKSEFIKMVEDTSHLATEL